MFSNSCSCFFFFFSSSPTSNRRQKSNKLLQPWNIFVSTTVRATSHPTHITTTPWAGSRHAPSSPHRAPFATSPTRGIPTSSPIWASTFQTSSNAILWCSSPSPHASTPKAWYATPTTWSTTHTLSISGSS